MCIDNYFFRYLVILPRTKMSIKIFKIGSHTWRDERNVFYKKRNRREVVTSDGRVLRTPQAGEKIFVDGCGNGFIFD